ncbi:hypothetical protein E0H83_03030 [Acinetobacter terrestris]|jgi:hypothetical protein|uniref:hypothetical protein n=2 Tax=Acinetobacter terrestris TaxID=2529843 RepID=UPI00104091DB|nr:hypothetical protein [Acinetobacter terrestris]TCB47469.1 hypothetical protein E0H83_03030 [Acinetobacter terrestris]TCB56777.1 hypothetical protein E0H84_02685 [Acinetobacter terrestris]
MLFFNLNGVVGEKNNDQSFYKNLMGEYFSLLTEYTYQFEKQLINLEHSIQKCVFGKMEAYWEASKVLYSLQEIGLSSESKLSVQDFESIVIKNLPENTLKYLYVNEIGYLISNVQNVVNSIIQILGSFFEEFNDQLLVIPAVDGCRVVSSPRITALISKLNSVIISLGSLLDYAAKLVYEIENLRVSFSSYQKLECYKKDIKHGKRNLLRLNELRGSLFESDSPSLTFLKEIRNRIIHDGFLDVNPQLYEFRENGDVKERFILLPDLNQSGKFEKCGSRSNFYSRDTKLNIEIINLTKETFERFGKTVDELLKLIK